MIDRLIVFFVLSYTTESKWIEYCFICFAMQSLGLLKLVSFIWVFVAT